MRCFTRCAKHYHTFFEGYKVPMGAIYGRMKYEGEELFWVCESPKDIRGSYVHVHLMKRTWDSNATRTVRCMHWNYTLLPVSHLICKEIKDLCEELGGYPIVKTYTDPKKAYKTKGIPMPRRKVNSMAMFRPGTQSRVDGKGYSLSWEEDYLKLDNYSGLPVHYEQGKTKPPCAFTHFDGVTDTLAARRRDGMKVLQHKCRPGKPYVVD